MSPGGRYRMLALIVGAFVLLPIVVLGLFSLFSPPPEQLGLVEGKLRPCSSPRNCICTQQPEVFPDLPSIDFTDSAESALDRLERTLQEMPGIRVVQREGNYLRAEAVTKFFRFVDDLEFVVDPATNSIHYRSASRVGRSDLGMNRKRIETVIQNWKASAPEGEAPSTRKTD